MKSSGNKVVKAMRWTARIIALLMVLITLLFMVGEAMSGNHTQGNQTAPMMIVMGAMMLGGLVIAWKWELWGSLISLIGFVGVGVLNPNAFTKPGMYIFAIPSILFLVCVLLDKLEAKS